MHLNVDTSWYLRYRSSTNPDFGATFPQALKLNNVTVIPRNNNDFNGTSNPNFPGDDHIQPIANVAAFHFGYIEQCGSSLYAALGQKISSLEALKIAFGIGGDEVAHLLEWVDFGGNAVQALVEPFTDKNIRPVVSQLFHQPAALTAQSRSAQPDFSRSLRIHLPRFAHCAVIRPSDDKFAGAVATIASFTADGLFVGQSSKFLHTVNQLAEEADAATREI